MFSKKIKKISGVGLGTKINEDWARVTPPWYQSYTYEPTTTEIPLTEEELAEQVLDNIKIEYIERYLRKKKLNNIETKKDVL